MVYTFLIKHLKWISGQAAPLIIIIYHGSNMNVAN